MSFDISHEFLSLVCQVLNVGCTYDPTDSGLFLTWTDFAFIIVPILALFAIIFLIVTLLLRNRASRTAILCGYAGTCVSSVCYVVSGIMVIYGYVTEDLDYVIAAAVPIPLNMILLFVSVCILSRSTIQLPRSFFFFSCLPFILIFITSIITLHFFPIFSECTFNNLLLTMFIVFLVSGTSTMAIDSFCCFLVVSSAEKLYIMKDFKVVGQLVKKGSEWVEIQLENVENTSKLNIV